MREERWLRLVSLVWPAARKLAAGRMDASPAAGETPGGPDGQAEADAAGPPPPVTFRVRGEGPRAGQRWDLCLRTNGRRYWLLRDPRCEYLEMQQLLPDYEGPALAAARAIERAAADPRLRVSPAELMNRVRRQGAGPEVLAHGARLAEWNGGEWMGPGSLRILVALFRTEGALGPLAWVIWQRRRGERRWRKHRLMLYHGIVVEAVCR